ncbi:MAG: hypothetical protein ACLP3C_24800 [Mycobacterium sp.]|uniref:hypothetical protein n=1 Tax=Mycobacterium sp. TaxID=1785 RepID=UPI003F9D517F
MNTIHFSKRVIGGALLSGVAAIGLGWAPGAAHAQPGFAPPTLGPVLADAPAPSPPAPPPPPRKVCWALFLPAPYPPPPH